MRSEGRIPSERGAEETSKIVLPVCDRRRFQALARPEHVLIAVQDGQNLTRYFWRQRHRNVRSRLLPGCGDSRKLLLLVPLNRSPFQSDCISDGKARMAHQLDQGPNTPGLFPWEDFGNRLKQRGVLLF